MALLDSKAGEGRWRGIAKQVRLRDGSRCRMCGRGQAEGASLSVDHIIPREQGGGDELTNLQTLCDACHGLKSGIETTRRARRRSSGGAPQPRVLLPSISQDQQPARTGPGSDEPDVGGWRPEDEPNVWGFDLAAEDVPWPRFMSRPHPTAVGTLGWEFIEWAEAEPQRAINPKRSGGLRPWQKLVALRALEVDAEGRLCWRTIVLTVSRQSGKSWLLRALMLWRLQQGDRLGEQQAILHIAHKLSAAMEVWRPATRWALAEWGKGSVRFANGEQRIEAPDGSRWLIQAANDGAGVSMSLSAALVDEAWRVKREIVDGAIDPTFAEAEQPQLYLVSTAGDWSSDLMLAYRQTGIETLDRPESLLLLEWSAHPGDDPAKPATWKRASPFWSDRREETIRDKRSKVTDAEFRTQWLNQWVADAGTGMVLLSAEAWNGAARSDLQPPIGDGFGIVVEVEDNIGEGSAVAVAWAAGSGVIGGYATAFPNLMAAWLELEELRERWPQCAIQVGLTLRHDPALLAIEPNPEGVGTAETRAALPLLRELLNTGRLLHTGGQDLTIQITSARVKPGAAGGLGVVHVEGQRTDLARAFARAVQSAHRQVGTVPAIF